MAAGPKFKRKPTSGKAVPAARRTPQTTCLKCGFPKDNAGTCGCKMLIKPNV